MNIGACAMAVIFLSVCSRTNHDLGRPGREKLLGLPLCRYDTGVSSPLVAAGIEWFRSGDALIAPTASQTNGRNRAPERPQVGVKPPTSQYMSTKSGIHYQMI